MKDKILTTLYDAIEIHKNKKKEPQKNPRFHLLLMIASIIHSLLGSYDFYFI